VADSQEGRDLRQNSPVCLSLLAGFAAIALGNWLGDSLV